MLDSMRNEETEYSQDPSVENMFFSSSASASSSPEIHSHPYCRCMGNWQMEATFCVENLSRIVSPI